MNKHTPEPINLNGIGAEQLAELSKLLEPILSLTKTTPPPVGSVSRLHPVAIMPTAETQAELAKLSPCFNVGIFDAMDTYLKRAKHLASGLGHAHEHPQAMHGDDAAAIAYTIAENVEKAIVLMQGLYTILLTENRQG